MNLIPDIVLNAIEQSDTSIIITDLNGVVIYATRRIEETTGYTQEELIGQNIRVLNSGYHPQSYFKSLWASLRVHGFWKGEFRNLTKSGKPYWEQAHISRVVNEKGETTHYISVMRDITKEKIERNEAERRERLLNDIQELSKTGGWEYDVASSNMYWTDELYELHAFDRPFNSSHIEQSLNCYFEDDRRMIGESFVRCVQDGIDYDHTVRFKTTKGENKWVRTKSHAIKDKSGKVTKIIGSVRDVTDEKIKELEIRDSERRFQAVVNSFDDIVFTLDEFGRHSALYGQWSDDPSVSEFLLGKTAIEIMGEKLGSTHAAAFEEAIKGETVVYEWQTVNQQSQTEYYQTKLTPLINETGSIIGVLGVGRNISTEKQFQNQLKESVDRLKYALHGTQAATWDWYVKTGETVFSERWAEIIGYKLDELEPISIKTWLSFVHPDDLKITNDAVKEHFERKTDYYDVRVRMHHKDGHWVWVWDRGQVVEWDEQGEPIRMVGTHVDVTEWVNAEELLKNSERRYRDLFMRSPDAAVLFKELTVVDCNPAMLRLMGYESIHEVIGKEVFEFIPEFQPDGTRTMDLHIKNSEIVTKMGSHKFEFYHKKRDNTLIPIEVTVTKLTDLEGDPFLYVVWRDITNRKKAEEALRDSLKEKETLLSEIHHRVKNNLAVISALMQLQIYANEDPYAVEILSKSIHRIKSIALIHEQLYRSENFTRISLKENIERQIKNIMEMYSSSITSDIKIDLKLNEVGININQAMPIGLLFNEIINNIYKHAFKGRANGNIYILLEQVKSEIHLVISDDGVGFNPSTDPQVESSLGNTLIRSFLEQLGARYTLDSTNGTTYDIWFNKS